MKEKIRELFPEIEWIHDEAMRDKVVAAIEDGLRSGGWEPEDMDLIPNCPFSYLAHVRGVTRIAKLAMDEFNAIYAAKDEKFRMDNDLLVAGALLHDVGKLVEYEKNGAGETVKSRCGKNLRHPFSGTVIALRNGLPDEVGHIIANHAHEGDGTLRSPEAVVVNKADFINFESIKSFLGLK